jgi:hypothetical protein
MSTKADRIAWRQAKVMQMTSEGHGQVSISQILQVAQSTVNRDLQYLRKQSRANIQKYNERLPHEYDQCMFALRDILKQAFDITHDSETQQKEKLVAMNLIKEIVSAKIELLTNVTVVDDVVRFLNNKKENLKNIDNNSKKDSNNNNNNNNSDYNFGNEQKEQQVQRQKEDQGNDNDDKEIVTTTDDDVDLQVF